MQMSKKLKMSRHNLYVPAFAKCSTVLSLTKFLIDYILIWCCGPKFFHAFARFWSMWLFATGMWEVSNSLTLRYYKCNYGEFGHRCFTGITGEEIALVSPINISLVKQREKFRIFPLNRPLSPLFFRLLTNPVANFNAFIASLSLEVEKIDFV